MTGSEGRIGTVQGSTMGIREAQYNTTALASTDLKLVVMVMVWLR